MRELEQGDLPGPAPVRLGVVVELVHDHQTDVGRAHPSRSAWLASTSAVAAMIGAPGLTAASPVSMPTRSAPNTSQSAKNFSETSALIGAV